MVQDRAMLTMADQESYIVYIERRHF